MRLVSVTRLATYAKVSEGRMETRYREQVRRRGGLKITCHVIIRAQ